MGIKPSASACPSTCGSVMSNCRAASSWHCQGSRFCSEPVCRKSSSPASIPSTLASSNQGEDGQPRALLQFAVKLRVPVVDHDQAHFGLVDAKLLHDAGNVAMKCALALLLHEASFAELGEKLDGDMHGSWCP